LCHVRFTYTADFKHLKTFVSSGTVHQNRFLYANHCVLVCSFNEKIIIKNKCTLLQALRLCTGRTAHRGSRSIALPFLNHGSRRADGSASRPGRSLSLGKTRYPLHRRLGGPQGRSGQVRKISTPPGFYPRTVQPVASRYTDHATRPT
jgi:hypothetical protein